MDTHSYSLFDLLVYYIELTVSWENSVKEEINLEMQIWQQREQLQGFSPYK